MTRRSRTLAYGAAGALVLAGICCAIFVSGEAGQLLAFVLVAFGLGGATLLVFYEVGLSEDRDRAREEQQRRRAERAPRPARNPRFKGTRFRRRP